MNYIVGIEFCWLNVKKYYGAVKFVFISIPVHLSSNPGTKHIGNRLKRFNRLSCTSPELNSLNDVAKFLKGKPETSKTLLGLYMLLFT